MTYEVRFTPLAREKVFEQAAYIVRERRESETAARCLQRVLKAANSLETLPGRCERAEEDAYLPYDIRVRRVDTYMLLYTIVEESKTVWIVNARSGRQLPQPGLLPSDPGQSMRW